MPKISKKLTTIIIILACLAAVFAVRFYMESSRDGVSSEVLAKVKGSKKAPIKVTEFIDFQCPACAYGAKYLKQMIEKYPDAIRVEVKHFPLRMHKFGLLSSQYAECAAKQDKFWQFSDLLLERQKNWYRLDNARPAFEQIARDVSLDGEQLKSCLEDPAIEKIIEDNRAEGKRLGIKSTPTYYINGSMVVGGRNLQTEMTALLEKNGF